MLRAAAVRPLSSSFTCLIVAWTVCTCLFTASGGHYVKTTLDCLTPALLAQAFVCVLYSITSGFRTPKKDSYEQHHVGRRAWVLALGLLHLMSSILTLASFGLSSVSETYIIRTLEPICSCLLLYVLHGQKRTTTELLLLAVVAGATAAVVLAGPQPGKGLLLSNALGDEHASQYHAPGGDVPVALALVATLVISCRSVASKTVAALTGTTEYDTFLEASGPGLVAAVFLQVSLWVLFGVQPLQGLQAGWPPAVPATLLVCGVSQCAYNAASFKVLQQCSPVMHGMLNVLKRVFIIVGCAVLLGSPLTAVQLVGVLVANAAAVAYALQQAQSPGSSCGNAHAAVAAEHVDSGSEDKTKARKSWFGSGQAPSVQALSRLVYIVGATLVVSALFLAYVVAALQSSSVSQQQQGQMQQAQSHQLLHLQLQQEWEPAYTAAAAAAEVAGGFADVGVYPLSMGTSVSGNSTMVNGTAAGAGGVRISEAVQQYLVRDFGRIQCLTALHEASKASLAPFLHNRTRGSIALFDVALHKNLGDAVLWAAAARLVPTFHESVKYVCAQSQFPGRGAEARKAFPKCNVKAMTKAIGREGVVLLAPGGNWGDLWWFVHSQRLQYLKEMAAESRNTGAPFKVVQLPQSLTFSNQDKIQSDGHIINSMPPGMLTLFTRQEESLDYAQAHYPNTTVLPGPDLAFSLGPLMGGEAQYDVLFLMRRDKEAAGSEEPLVTMKQHSNMPAAPKQGAAAAAAVDTVSGGKGAGNSSSLDGNAAAAAAEALEGLQKLGLTYSIREWEFQHENCTKEVSKVALVQVAESRLQGAVDVISLGKVVVTNRLHAAIMANLVGRPLIWIDTQHRKISGVRSLAFSHSSSCTERNLHSAQASSFAEAAGIAAKWLTTPDFIWSAQQLQLPHLRRR